MSGTSQHVVTIVIWALTLAGSFFGGRAAWRRRRQKRAQKPTSSEYHPSQP